MDDKWQITAVLAVNMTGQLNVLICMTFSLVCMSPVNFFCIGELLPLQLIYRAKTTDATFKLHFFHTGIFGILRIVGLMKSPPDDT